MGSTRVTRGQMEARISDAVTQFEKEYMGRGPKDIKTRLLQNHIFIIIDGFLSQSEQKLAHDAKGIGLIKEMRSALFEASRENLVKNIKDIIGLNIVSTHSDVSTKTGEKIIVLTVEGDLEARYV